MTSVARSTGASTILTPALAQEIAGETSSIIGLNIIITNDEGIVIGSGDQSRVGSFHEASIEVIASQRSAAHNAEEARRLVGVRPGMTLPIVHGGVGVGTVGITGSPVRVRRFGQVVKRQTEILLEEAVLLRSRLTRERVLENLVRELLNYDADNLADMTTRAKDFGFDLSLPRQAVVFEVAQPADSSEGTTSSPLRLIRETFHTTQDISCSLSSTTHVILRPRHDDGVSARGDLIALAERILAQLGRRSRIGIGGVAPSAGAIELSYADAQTALRIGASTGEDSPYDINDLRVEQIVAALPGRLRSRVSDEIIGTMRSSSDWPTTRATVLAWVESGFVLVDASTALNVHRNTLVYRLGRIAKHTGWPTSDRRHWLALYLACVSDNVAP
jgi:carbohydrate diacid regulator